MATQTSFSSLSALIVDDMAVQQSTLRGQLTSLGITKVEQASNPDDAVKLVRSRNFGLILCDYNLNHKTDGQQLLEHLRDSALLSPDCLFFMVTAESAYISVASATEHVPDAYLLKPITASNIAERLTVLLERRQALLAISERLEQNDLNAALAECDKLIAAKNRWLMQALQLKGQVLLKLGKHDEAKQTYRGALDLRPQLAWAQLGMARAHKAAGEFDDARMLAQDLIDSKDGQRNVAAYDVLAETMEAQGDLQGALDALRSCAEIVPSARRHRQLGECAYRNGHLETARDSLQRATKATKGSVVAQPQDTLTLAQTLVDMKDPGAALKLLADSGPALSKAAGFESASLALKVQAQVQTGDTAGANESLKRARELQRKGKADFATIALAKAELASGNEEAGLKLLETAVSADHENPVLRQMIGKALRDTGHDDKVQKIIDSAAAALDGKVKAARLLLRDGKMDAAVAAIEAAAREFPENTGVLLQATQISCMSLRFKKERNTDVVERVRRYLARLEKLLPGNDRVIQMNRFFRETLAALESAAVAQS